MTLIILLRLLYEIYFRFPHFRVLRAGIKKWIRNGEDEIISYQLELRAKKNSSELAFEELWIDDRKYRLLISSHTRKIASHFSEKEVISLSAGEMLPGTCPPPKSSKGIIILGYTFRNKKKYVSIRRIRDIEELKLSEN